MTKKNPFTENKYEILWNVINSAIAGLLVFLGACSSGDISLRGLFIATIAMLVVFVTKMKDYWLKQESEYSKLFTFIQL